MSIPSSVVLLTESAKFGEDWDYISHDMPGEGNNMRMVVNRGDTPLAIVVGGITVRILMPQGTYPMSDSPDGPPYSVKKIIFPKEEDWAG